eukprot:6255534-Amphidinium_carterae.1
MFPKIGRMRQTCLCEQNGEGGASSSSAYLLQMQVVHARQQQQQSVLDVATSNVLALNGAANAATYGAELEVDVIHSAFGCCMRSGYRTL